MSWSLRARLALSFAAVALLAVLAVSVLANIALEGAFRRYVRTGQETANRQLVETIGRQRLADGSWDRAGLENTGMAALERGVILRVVDSSGAVVWDANEHNSGLCLAMIEHMAANMASRYLSQRGAYTEESYAVAGGATATVGFWGPFFLDDVDLAFLNALNRLLAWVTLAVLAPAAGAGVLAARRISRPLDRVADATRRIADGDRAVRIIDRTRIRELDRISAAVNDLSRALDDQEALRRRLTADVAHELRTPLATLQSHLEALVDGVWQPEPERLGGLHEEVLRLNRLVGDLERLARLEADAASLERLESDVVALVRGIVRNHDAQFMAKGVALRGPAGDEAPVAASVDPDRLSQAIINLLSNALKFTPVGGNVDVTVAREEGGVEIAVCDTGIGILPDDLSRVFERFYRADASRGRAGNGGTGIGLTIARAIVEAHGGTVSAASEPGTGSTFTIRLPG
ncbi:MAG: ATP-binding protein [Spirochaetes bacterium]|nr:ATP-binding protein [Spirochaetota bacterium]